MRISSALVGLLCIAPVVSTDSSGCVFVPVDNTNTSGRRLQHHPHHHGCTPKGHYICPPAGKARGELLLNWEGSACCPGDDAFLGYLQHAQSLGFHIFDVQYPNNPAMGKTCKDHPPECFEQERLARMYGGKQYDGQTIAEKDGGMTRFVKVLKELPKQRPNEGWEAFLDEKQPDGINWGKIVSSGHSQGAGMAPLLGKRRALAGVVQLSGVDDVTSEKKPAPWITKPGLTPASSLFGLGHQKGFACFTWTVNWPAQNMTGWSDASAESYQGQMLCGTAESSQNYHRCTITDSQFKPAWTYMLLRGKTSIPTEGGVTLDSCQCQSSDETEMSIVV